MTQSSAVASRSRYARDLDVFDYAFNGALNKAQVDELVTADFVGRGENLIIVGGAGTGKTVIASAANDAASAHGLSTEYLGCPSGFMADHALVDYGAGYVGSEYIGSAGSRRGLSEKLLNCDLLVVDEVHRWLEISPVLFMLLIGRRVELGKSNILVFTSSGWARTLVPNPRSLSSDSSFYLPACALDVECEKNSMFAREIKLERITSVKELMEFVGITFQLPTMAAEDVELQPSRSTWRRLSPSTKAPVWHSLYSGENSYRPILRRRYA